MNIKTFFIIYNILILLILGFIFVNELIQTNRLGNIESILNKWELYED